MEFINRGNNVILSENCDRNLLVGFLTNRLEIDERLDFLIHLEACGQCWEEVYKARKAEHPHYYKRTNRQVRLSEKELKRIDALSREEREEDQFQVA